MELVLTVVQSPPGVSIQSKQTLFGPAGGIIGRGDMSTCQLPCPDRVVSSQHASIGLQNGQFCLIDTSKNGTEVNGSPAPTQAAQALALKEGDRIQCGRFILEVAIKAPAALPKGVDSVDFLDSPALPSAAAMAPLAVPSPQAQSASAPNFDSASSDFSNSGFDSVGAADANSLDSEGLDSWLDGPNDDDGDLSKGNFSTGPGNNSDGWGTVAESQAASPDALVPATANPEQPAFDDPNGHWEDDWWKGGNDNDHAPAASQHIDISASTSASDPFQSGSNPAHSAATDVSSDVMNQWGEVQSTELPQASIPTPAPTITPRPKAVTEPGSAFNVDSGIESSNIDDVLGFDEPGTQSSNIPISSTATSPLQPSTPNPVATQATPQDSFIGSNQSSSSQPSKNPISHNKPPVNHNNPIAATQSEPDNVAPTNTEQASAGYGLGKLLGLNPKVQLPEATIAPTVVNIVKRTIAQLMDLMRARTNIKNELRVQHTTLQAQDNNPLKFAVNADDALNILFSESRSASFLTPEEAINDSFNDLSDHQIAVLAGMQAAYEHMLKQFSPAKLNNQFNSKSGLLGNKKAQNWQAFEQYYAQLLSDKEGSYNQLFGRAFTQQYEHNIAELKSQRMLRQSSSQ